MPYSLHGIVICDINISIGVVSTVHTTLVITKYFFLSNLTIKKNIIRPSFQFDRSQFGGGNETN